MLDFLAFHIPHAPKLGLYIAPIIPEPLLARALGDLGLTDLKPDRVLCLYDSTLARSGDDGAIFLSDGFHFQNSDEHLWDYIRYKDIREVGVEKRFLGQDVELKVRYGSGHVTKSIECIFRPHAAEHLATFLQCLLIMTKEELEHLEQSGMRAGREHPNPDGGLPDIGLAQSEGRDHVKRMLESLSVHGYLSDNQLEELIEVVDSWQKKEAPLVD